MRRVSAVLLFGLWASSAPAAAQPPAPAPPGVATGAAPTGLPDVPATAYYALQPSDVLVVKYRYTPEYDATVSVRPDGFVTLPIVGEVKVSGLTVHEAGLAIRAAAERRLRDPELTLELRDFQKPRFVVGGEVDKPGQFELRGRVSVLEAIAMAGGFTPSAKHSKVVLFRRFDATRAVTRVIDAKTLTRPDRIQEDPDLRPGDFLFVPRNRISKIERLIPFTSIGWLIAPWMR